MTPFETFFILVYILCGILMFDYLGFKKGFEDFFEMIYVGTLIILGLWMIFLLIHIKKYLTPKIKSISSDVDIDLKVPKRYR